MNTALRLFLLFLTVWAQACEPQAEEDTHVGPSENQAVDIVTSQARWTDVSFRDSSNQTVLIDSETLDKGGPQLPVNLTFSQANSVLGIFRSLPNLSDDAVNLSTLPYLAFFSEEGANVSIRHIKSRDGRNVSSQVVVPIECPDYFSESPPENVFEIPRLHCIPLINATVPGFLVPTDSGRAYIHKFQVSVKFQNSNTATLSTEIATKIVIPNTPLSIRVSSELRAISLRERLLIHTKDLRGAPRSDFKTFEIRGDIAPGVETSWILSFRDAKMVIEEEVFFEQPVVPGSDPSNPSVSRGAQFYKRRVAIDSENHFKMLVINAYDEKETYGIAKASGESIIEMPIKSGTDPLWIYLSPDFGSEAALKTMSEYLRPFGPSFCPREQATFKPEEWRQSSGRDGFVACDAFLRTKIIDRNDATAKGAGSTMETFFGSFSYLPRLSSKILGGTSGVLSYRLSVSGSLEVGVRNPREAGAVTAVASFPLEYTYLLPTALNEIDDLIKAGTATPGLDTLLSSMLRKGLRELPRQNEGQTPAFPFMGQLQDDIMY
jgi:hypothetical protein